MNKETLKRIMTDFHLADLPFVFDRRLQYEYLEYMVDAYILFRTAKYSSSIRAQQQNPSKYLKLFNK